MVELWVFIMIGILVIALLVLAVAIYLAKINEREGKKFSGKFPEGHFVGQGMAIFMPVGVGIGVALGNIGLGIAIGVAIGVAIGAGWEEKAKREGKIRKMTSKEKSNKRRLLYFTIGLLVFGLLAFLVFYFLR